MLINFFFNSTTSNSTSSNITNSNSSSNVSFVTLIILVSTNLTVLTHQLLVTFIIDSPILIAPISQEFTRIHLRMEALDAAYRTRVFEVKSLMDEITTLFKNLKDHAGSKTASKKASKAAKGASKRFQRMTQKELILAYEHAIDAAETKLRLPLSLIGVDYRTVIPEALDKRFDNPDYKRRLQALHDRHVQWMAIIEDRTAPWCA